MYTTILERVSNASFELATRAQATSSGARFGLRVHQHNQELAEAALECAANVKLAPWKAGLLMIGSFCEDIGRSIGALPYEERILFVPESERTEDWKDDTKAQHRHGDLSYFYLSANEDWLLAELTTKDRQIIKDVARQHSLPRITVDQDSPSYYYCVTGRDLDRKELLERCDFLKPEGALKQFMLWGLKWYGLKAIEVEVTNKFESSPELKSAAGKYLHDLFSGTIEERMAACSGIVFKNECGNDPLANKIADAMIDYFGSPPSQEILERALNWGMGRSSEPPVIVKTANNEELIERYSQYMLSHLYMLLDFGSKGVVEPLLVGDGVKQRDDYIKFLIGEDSYDYYLNPAFDRLRAELQ